MDSKQIWYGSMPCEHYNETAEPMNSGETLD